MSTQAATQAPQPRKGCASGLWLMIKLPFMFLRTIPRIGEIVRHEAATTTGERAQASYEQLTPAANPDAVAAVLATVRSRDPGFDLDATTRAVVRARAVVNQARQSGDASAARQVMSQGLWSVFAILLHRGAARGLRREEKSGVVSARQLDWEFVRPAGHRTDPEAVLLPRTCASCGGPYRSEFDDACPYCHAPRADSQAGWRLDRNYLVVDSGGR